MGGSGHWAKTPLSGCRGVRNGGWRVRNRNALFVAAVAAVASASPAAFASRLTELVEIESFLAPGNAVQMQYSSDAGMLFLRGSGSVIRVVDTSTHLQRSWRMATNVFSDMDLTPDGQYLYAADFGGEVIGYGTPVNTHYVHRYNLSTGAWESQAAPGIAYRIEAVDSNRVLLLSSDQWVDLTLNRWGAGIVELSSKSWALYYGDIQYDAVTGRVLHGGPSFSDITTYQVVGDTLVEGETSGDHIYGNSGSTVVLSTDGRNFYYGSLQVDALNVASIRRMFAEPVYAASADIAFGQNGYYDALTGQRLGGLGFSATAYALDPGGTHLWAFDPVSDMLHHYAIVPEPAAVTGLWLGLLPLVLSTRRRQSRGAQVSDPELPAIFVPR
jgi:hypothetical protein